MMERNGSNQNDDGTATEDTLDSNKPIENVTTETQTVSVVGDKDSATTERSTRSVDDNNDDPVKRDSGNAILKGGSNTDLKSSVKDASVVMGCEQGEHNQGENSVSEITSGISSLSLNSTAASKDSQDTTRGCKEGGTEWEEPEVVDCNGKQETSKEDGDSTPTNVNSLSPTVMRKNKKPPPLIPPPPAPVSSSINSKVSPPLSPLSPSIKAKATSPLGPRYHAKSQECSVQSCLSQFTSPEWLTGANKFGCEHCTAKKGKGKILALSLSVQSLNFFFFF